MRKKQLAARLAELEGLVDALIQVVCPGLKAEVEGQVLAHAILDRLKADAGQPGCLTEEDIKRAREVLGTRLESASLNDSLPVILRDALELGEIDFAPDFPDPSP